MQFRRLLIFSLLLLASCLRDKDYDFSNVTLSPSIAFPLATGNISILDLISTTDSSYLKVYPDGLVYFYYTQTLPSDDIRKLFDIADNNSVTSFDLPTGTLPPTSQDVELPPTDRLLDLNLSPEQLTEMLLKGGSLVYTIGTTPLGLTLPYEVKVSLTDVVEKTTLSPLAFVSSTGLATKPLQGYMIKMNKNKFNVRLTLVLKKRPSAVFVPPGAKVNVQLNFTSLDFDYIKGFFGDQTATLPVQTIELGVFSSSLKKSNVTFVQPMISMNVENQYGMKCEVTFSKLEAAKNNAVLPLQINPSSPVNLNYPAVLGTSATTNVAITNAQAIIDFSPTRLTYAATARINKGVLSAENFLTGNGLLKVTLTTEVPLYGRASNVKMIDTLKVDLGDVKESSINTASLHVQATNELPLDANIQIYLADPGYKVLDSLFAPNQTYLVKSSSVTGAGDLQTAGISDQQINLNPGKLSRLFSTDYLIIKTTFNTTKDATGGLLNVKFKAAYKLKLTVGLNAKLNVKLE